MELFLLKCAVIESGIRTALAEHGVQRTDAFEAAVDKQLEPLIKQFELSNRRKALEMARYYEIFYMLENDIRRLIIDTMEAAHGSNWWSQRVPQSVLDEVEKNKAREAQAGVTARSDDDIDYTTFGQLGDIIRHNWPDFAGMLSNEKAVGRVMSGLNMLRGTIAHCGVLADDEVDRLKLAIRDWFRILEGPKI